MDFGNIRQNHSNSYYNKYSGTYYSHSSASNRSYNNYSQNRNQSNYKYNNQHNYRNDSKGNSYYYNGYTSDNWQSNGFYQHENNQYKYKNKNDNEGYNNENIKSDRCYIYRDPYTGRYFKIYPGRSSNQRNNQNNMNYDAYSENIYKEDHKNRYGNYSPYNDDYDAEEELSLNLRQIILIFILASSTIFYFIYKANKKLLENKNNVILYKNSIYYPIDKDPLLDNIDPYIKRSLERRH
jgi:hypothetical protein